MSHHTCHSMSSSSAICNKASCPQILSGRCLHHTLPSFFTESYFSICSAGPEMELTHWGEIVGNLEKRDVGQIAKSLSWLRLTLYELRSGIDKKATYQIPIEDHAYV